MAQTDPRHSLRSTQRQVMIDDKMCLVSSSLLQSSNGQPRSIYFGDRLQNCNVQHRYDMFLLKHCVFPALFFFFSLIFISTLSGCATTNGVSKPIKELNDGSETVCSQEDYVNRVSAADHCLAIDILQPEPRMRRACIRPVHIFS